MIAEPGRSAIRTTLKESTFIFGTINLSWLEQREAFALFEHALGHGVDVINFTDAAYDGRSETLFGGWARGAGDLAELMIIAEVSGTDMGVPAMPNLHPSYIKPAVRRTLDRLRVNTIDVLLLPRPNFAMPVEPILEAMAELAAEGLIRAFGTSTFPAWKIMQLCSRAERLGYSPPLLDESPYNVLDRRIENELIPACEASGMGVLAWAPLAQGMLSGTYSDADVIAPESRAARRGGVYRQRITAAGVARAGRFAAIAQSLDLLPCQLATAWIRGNPAVLAPVVGCRTRQHLDEALGSPLRLADTVRERIDSEVNAPGTAVVNFFNSAPWMKMRI